jgi:hypothetical protein
MKEDVKKWLESKTPDYNTGVLLFSKHSKNRSLLHYFTRKGNVAMDKLRYELGKIAGSSVQLAARSRQLSAAPTQQLNNSTIQQPATAVRTLPTATVADLPEHLRTLYNKNVEDYKILRGAHAAMAVAKTRAERKKFRKQIAKLDDAIAAHWKIIDDWVASGADVQAKNLSPLLSPQDINAYRTYISRGIAEPDKITEEKRATMQERITALLASGQKFDDTTVEKLIALGFTLE